MSDELGGHRPGGGAVRASGRARAPGRGAVYLRRTATGARTCRRTWWKDAGRRADERSLLDLFLQEYGLSNEEGIALLVYQRGVAADSRRRDRRGTDRGEDRDRELGGTRRSVGLLVFLNASTWALMLTGNVIGLGADSLTGDLVRLGQPTGRSRRRIRSPGLPCRARCGSSAAEFVQGRTIRRSVGAGAVERFGAVLLRHARRGRAHVRGCRALHRVVPSRAIHAVGNAYPRRDAERSIGESPLSSRRCIHATRRCSANASLKELGPITARPRKRSGRT